MTKRLAQSVAVISVVLALAGVSLLFGQQRTQPEQPEADFQGKTLLVYLKGEVDQSSIMVQDAKLVRIGDRLFLSGTSGDMGLKEDWTRGLPVRIAWDGVLRYYPLSAEAVKRVQEVNRQAENMMNAPPPGAVQPGGLAPGGAVPGGVMPNAPAPGTTPGGSRFPR